MYPVLSFSRVTAAGTPTYTDSCTLGVENESGDNTHTHTCTALTAPPPGGSYEAGDTVTEVRASLHVGPAARWN